MECRWSGDHFYKSKETRTRGKDPAGPVREVRQADHPVGLFD